jgi:hypothetical protein
MTESGPPLHVVEAVEGDGEQLVALVAELAVSADVDRPAVLIVGPERTARWATSLGCNVVGRICPVLRSPLLSARSIRAMVRHGLKSGGAGAQPRLAVWGSPHCAAICSDLSPDLTWVPFGSLGRLPEVLGRRLAGVRALAPDQETADRLRHRYDGLRVVVLPPGLATKGIALGPAIARSALRAEWRADEETLVVGAIGPAPAWTDYRRAADVVGIAAVRGAKVLLVGHPDSARAWRTRRWMQEVGLERHPLLVDERIARPWELATGLDAGLLLGDGARTAGAEAGGRRWGWLSHWPWANARTDDPAASEGPDCPSVPVSMPSIGGLWLARAGVPLVVEQGAIDRQAVGVDVEFDFRVDDPLRATRTLIGWWRDPAARRRAAESTQAALAAANHARRWSELMNGRSTDGQ